MKRIIRLGVIALIAAMASSCADGDSKVNDAWDDISGDGCTVGSVKCSDTGMLTFVCRKNEWEPAFTCPNGCLNGHCIEDNGSSQSVECVSNTRICSVDGKKLYTCASGVWTLGDVCENGCMDGACLSDSSKKCEENAKRCSSDGLESGICKNGNWETAEKCTDGCKNGECIKNGVPDCVDNNRKCADDNNRTMVCTNGVWVAGETCSNGCQNGQCVSGTPANECTNGSRKCADDNNSTFVCTNNVWTAADTCTNGCQNGQCISSTPSDKCTTGSKKCADDNKSTIVCVDSVWTAGDTCANGCKNGTCLSETPVETCTNDARKCSDDNSKAMLCVDNAWTEVQSCTDGCENGQCKNSGSYTCDEGLRPCDSSCTAPGGTTCMETCKSEGIDICCMNDTDFVCGTGMTEPPVYPVGTVFDCSDYYVEVDGEELTAAEYCGFELPLCTVTEEGNSLGCYTACKSSDNGKTQSVCQAFTDKSGNPFNASYDLVCKAMTDTIYAYDIDYSTAKKCDAACNSTNTACASSSSTSSCTNGYKACTSGCTTKNSEGETVSCASICESRGSDTCCTDDEYMYCYDPGSDKTVYCGDDPEYADACDSDKVTVCTTLRGKTTQSCEIACSASYVGTVVPVCYDLTDYDNGYLVVNYECINLDSHYAYVPDYDNLTECSSGCNAAGDGCK